MLLCNNTIKFNNVPIFLSTQNKCEINKMRSNNYMKKIFASFKFQFNIIDHKNKIKEKKKGKP